VDGVICPSEIVHDLLSDYKVKVEKRVIPTGIELAKFDRPEIQQENLTELRSKLGIQSNEKMLLSLLIIYDISHMDSSFIFMAMIT